MGSNISVENNHQQKMMKQIRQDSGHEFCVPETCRIRLVMNTSRVFASPTTHDNESNHVMSCQTNSIIIWFICFHPSTCFPFVRVKQHHPICSNYKIYLDICVEGDSNKTRIGRLPRFVFGDSIRSNVKQTAESQTICDNTVM
jgi:hypothetical protein